MDYSELNEDQQSFYQWIIHREEALVGYTMRAPKPWTADPIIQNYRFCNVRREDDKVTKWIKEHWRDPFDGHPNMPLAMVMARTINWPDTLAVVGFPDISNFIFYDWLERVRENIKHRRDTEQQKIWTGAYLVSTNGVRMDKVDYILDKVWVPIHVKLDLRGVSKLQEAHRRLMQFDGMGSFMAAQVVCDLKYTSVLRDATDWDTWAAIGPGSRRGLNRYYGRPLEGAISEAQFLREISELRFAVQQYCGIVLHGQDIQNCLCEYDKFLRVKKGEGKPRSKYDGSR